jgi:proteic killer suppression protein
MAIKSFKSKGEEDLFHGLDTKDARGTCPKNIWNVARRKLDYVNAAATLEDLRSPPGNQLEALAGDRAGQHSIRVNQQFRVCFRWTADGPRDVEVVDYH